MIERDAISGVVLAGGRGSRMGGADKGLQLFHGTPLALHAAQRLAPQVGAVAINANRHIAEYEAFGFPTFADDDQGAFAGPLAGALAGLAQCRTDWLMLVPCDAPHFPLDIVDRLVAAMQRAHGTADVAVASSVGPSGERLQPAFCLLSRQTEAALDAYLKDGGRKVERWLLTQRHAVARFDDEAAFFNANTREDLALAERGDAA